jgi:hypothetical protein
MSRAHRSNSGRTPETGTARVAMRIRRFPLADPRLAHLYPSINLVAAGASGFLILIQSAARPDQYGVKATIPLARA